MMRIPAVHFTAMVTFFGLASSRLGSVTRSTPFSKTADTFSAWTDSGMEIERLKENDSSFTPSEAGVLREPARVR